MSDSKQNHSDELDVVQPILEPMAESEISTILEFYPQAGRYRNRIRDGGRPYSATTVFATDNGEYFLKKRTNLWRPREDVLWRHRVIRHLRTREFPTPGVLENSFGSTLTETDGYYYELFERAQGEDIYRDLHSWMAFEKSTHAYQAGKMLAGFHKALSAFGNGGREKPGTPPLKPMVARFDLALNDDLEMAIRRRIEASPTLTEFFKQREWERQILPLYLEYQKEIVASKDILASWVTHGDWHANNLFFRDDRIVSVIDFHLTDVSFRLYDLAVALDRNGILWLDILAGNAEAVRFDVLRMLLKGYRSVAPVSQPEAEMLSLLMPVHQLDLALTNIEYYFGIEKSKKRAEWAYSIYLLEHTRHYRTEEGRKILEFIGEQADV